jgi:hypothetical protein
MRSSQRSSDFRGKPLAAPSSPQLFVLVVATGLSGHLLVSEPSFANTVTEPLLQIQQPTGLPSFLIQSVAEPTEEYPSIGEIIAGIAAEVPDEAWHELPRDLSTNWDLYRQGKK